MLCSQSRNSVSTRDRITGLVCITPLSVLCIHFFDNAANWGQQHQRPLFLSGCQGKAVLSPIILMAWGTHGSKVLNYLRQAQFQIVLLSKRMSDHMYQFLFQDMYLLSSLLQFLFKKFRTPFPKAFSPKPSPERFLLNKKSFMGKYCIHDEYYHVECFYRGETNVFFWHFPKVCSSGNIFLFQQHL